MKISETEFPRYTGLRDLTPGRVYRDDKSTELLFLGRGRYYREDGLGGWSAPSNNSFLYMKVKDLDAKLTAGRLTPDLKTYDPRGPGRSDFFKTVFFSQRPRTLVEDLGQRYPAEYFRNLVVKDLSGKYDANPPWPPYWWHIETKGG